MDGRAPAAQRGLGAARQYRNKKEHGHLGTTAYLGLNFSFTSLEPLYSTRDSTSRIHRDRNDYQFPTTTLGTDYFFGYHSGAHLLHLLCPELDARNKKQQRSLLCEVSAEQFEGFLERNLRLKGRLRHEQMGAGWQSFERIRHGLQDSNIRCPGEQQRH